MSEKLERWKAAEQIRAHVGWLAIITIVSGGAAITGGLLVAVISIPGIGKNLSRMGFSVAGLTGSSSSSSFLGHPVPAGVASAGMVLMGTAVLLCGLGLWHGRPWARWATAALCAGSLLADVLALLLDREIGVGAAFSLFGLVYLLLPSTGRLFARAQGRQPAEALSLDPPVRG